MDSTQAVSRDGSARSKSRKKPGKVKGASAQRGTGKRLTARLARVPLKQIQLSPEMDEAAALDPQEVSHVSEKHATLLSLQMLPVLTPDKGDPAKYGVLAHERIVRWIKAWVELHDLSLDAIYVLVVTDFGVAPAEAAIVERHLLPLVLGQLSRADEREARKALKEAGIPPPRRRTRRDQLKPLVKKREGAIEG